MIQARAPRLFTRPNPRSDLVAIAATAGVAVLIGVLAAAVSPLLSLGLLIAIPALWLVLWRPVLGLFGLLGVIGLLPFGVIPLRLGVQLTLVDAALIGTFLACALRLPRVLQRPERFIMGVPGLLLVVFVGLVVAAFVAGTGFTSPGADLVRRVAKLIASLLLFVVAINLVRRPSSVFALTRALILAGAAAGAIGAVLWLLPASVQLRLLTALQVVGYPADNVLRYVPGPNETYTDQLRAIGTAVDPNVFGGMLMLTLGLIAMQWVARERLIGRPWLLLLAAPTLAGLLASFSRASWLGLVVGVLAVGSVRYPRIWLWAVLAGIVLAVSPLGQPLVERFVGGLTSADPATALRFGEYYNAITIIQRYPLLGIGFGGSPDIDVTAGVSSVYLLVGQQTGLLGLAAYVGALLSILWLGFRALGRAPDERLRGVLSGFLAAFTAALVAGFLDHYFANHIFPHAVALFWLYAALLFTSARLAEQHGR